MDCPSTCAPSGAAASVFLAAITSLSNLQCKLGDPSIYPPDRSTPDETYDFIVIGGGTAGCVVANRLSSKWKVLLIEAGGDPPYTSEVPGLSNSLQNTDADWSYLSDGEGKYCLGMVNHKCRWAQGKSVGGSSMLNPMRYFRGNPEDYNRWAREGNVGWSYRNLEPIFNIIEGIEKEDGEVGHLNLEPSGGSDTPLLFPLRTAAREIGNKVEFVSQKLSILAYFEAFTTVSSGTRSSVAKSFLAPVKDRKNLHVVKNTLVLRILFDSYKRAIGVECEKNGKLLRIHTRKEVIVSSGAFAVPQLLMNSGIGPKEHLAKLGIKLVANLPVGEYMHGHIQLPAVVASIDRGSSVQRDSTEESIRNTVDYLVHRQGSLSGIGYGRLVGFIDSTHSNKSALPDNQINFSYFKKDDENTLITTLSTFGYRREVISSYIKLLKEGDLLVVTPSIQHPKSYGRVRLASNNPRDRPRITANYFSHEDDERAMFGGILEAMKLLRTCSLKRSARVEPRVLLPECLPRGSHPGSGQGNIDDSHLMTKSYWRCVIRKLAAPDFLPVGTCRMGPSPTHSVVDSKLRVHSVKGLRIIDACVMPHITTGDTQGAVVSVALNGARMIKTELGH